MLNKIILLHLDDDVVISTELVVGGTVVDGIVVKGLIPQGHKIA
jgi:altronate hydrolase